LRQCTRADYDGQPISGLDLRLLESAASTNGVRLLKCFVGDVVMAWVSLLIPASNDGLILIGIPLLQPYAGLAFVSMFGSIAAAMGAQRLWEWQAALGASRS
jgi:toxin CptA